MAVSGATLPRVGFETVYDTVVPASRAAELYAASLGASATPHPLDHSDGNEMWDPLGGGCIAAGDPAAWLSDGRRDPDAGAICIPQPCARPLTEVEMELDVLGRPMRDGEWTTYNNRYVQACVTTVMWGETAETGLDLLPEDDLDWVEVAHAGNLVVSRAGGLPGLQRRGGSAAPGVSWFGGGLGSGSRSIAGFPRERGTGSGAESDGGAGRDPAPGSEEQSEGNDRPGWQRDEPDGSLVGDGPGGGDGGDVATPDVPQPTPVPLPGSFVLLAAAVAALRLPRG